MFHKYSKSQQHNAYANTWQSKLKKREVLKNNYHATGDIKKAKAFAGALAAFTFKTDFVQTVEQVIFSRDTLAIPIPTFF